MQRLVNDVVSTRRISLSYEDPLTTSQVASKEGLQKKQESKKMATQKISSVECDLLGLHLASELPAEPFRRRGNRRYRYVLES